MIHRATLLITVVLFSLPISNSFGQDQHAASQAISQFEIHPDLQVELFAAEPMLANPSNIDVDHLGRVWVCEVINYRHFRNKDAKLREAGDRILILEDSDGDAQADKTTVFYQGRDIDSAHGICVLGDRAIVSANDSVFFLIDTDGDSKADKKEILFTGISGTQHDHGIHAFVFGPDGKLYFNFGNEGKQIKDRHGKPIVDMAGNVVANHRKPYNQGMVFRCNLDGSQFETLGWNFRNNWEVCIDSFGTLWQSDNDDDGNKATRINYVMPFGNYGYTDQVTGGGWRTPRTHMHPDIPSRHWHQNDPGVIPNLLVTGAGSPTGICVYEGDALPTVFRNQMIHCDAGPNIVRAYPVTNSGAGYAAEIVDVMDGASNNQWFRPSDVCVAPDGSLLIADWYDPGVGGHRMQDIERGRLFRVSTRGSDNRYTTPKIDLSNPRGAVSALKSPNQATRYLAWKALHQSGSNAMPELNKLWKHDNPRFQARALWLIGKLEIDKREKLSYIRQGLAHSNPDLRIAAIRLSTQLRDHIEPDEVADLINLHDDSPQVRRSILIALRDSKSNSIADDWATLADQYEPGDRWYLEALGIAADGRWDACLDSWIQKDPSKVFTNAGQDIVWRSRAKQTPELLKKIIVDSATQTEQVGRYFRAFDLLANDQSLRNALRELAFGAFEFPKEKSTVVTIEAVSRMDTQTLTESQRAKLDRLIDESRGSATFIQFVDKFSSAKHYPDLLKLASQTEDRQMAADAMRILLQKNQAKSVHQQFVNAEMPEREALAEAMVNCGERRATGVLAGVSLRKDLDLALRSAAIKSLGQTSNGGQTMLNWIDKKQPIDERLMPSIQAALHRSQNGRVRDRAQTLFPIAQTKDKKPFPPMQQLVGRQGNIERGQTVFTGTGTCAKCHVVAGKGIDVGPDLSEIGSKLTKLAMYESILFPSAGISHNYENWLVLKDDGQVFKGILLGETATQLILKDEKGIKHTLLVDEIEDKQKLSTSLMPNDLHQEMSEQELVDLIGYLMSLKKSDDN
ncbi:MAG: PVC-type heme-binding CxxCH protein [Planctomycetota bacterium]